MVTLRLHHHAHIQIQLFIPRMHPACLLACLSSPLLARSLFRMHILGWRQSLFCEIKQRNGKKNGSPIARLREDDRKLYLALEWSSARAPLGYPFGSKQLGKSLESRLSTTRKDKDQVAQCRDTHDNDNSLFTGI
jgi:hypothetical protein